MSAADVLDDLVAFHRDDVDPVARCSTADPRREEDWGVMVVVALGTDPARRSNGEQTISDGNHNRI